MLAACNGAEAAGRRCRRRHIHTHTLFRFVVVVVVIGVIVGGGAGGGGVADGCVFLSTFVVLCSAVVVVAAVVASQHILGLAVDVGAVDAAPFDGVDGAVDNRAFCAVTMVPLLFGMICCLFVAADG